MTYARNKALSLVELLCCITLLGVFASIGLPGFANLLEHYRNETLRHELASALQAARAYSILHNHGTELCGSRTGDHCDSTWAKGWRIQHTHAPIQLFQTHLDGTQTLSWKGFSKTIRFQPDGTTPISNGRFTLCNQKKEAVWQLVLNRQGRVRHVKGQDPLDRSQPCQNS